jgi:hypothetical protein
VALTWPRVPFVEVGDRVTSSQWNNLAESGNQRLISGLADGSWRISNSAASLFRAVRNPDASFNLFPPQLEQFEVYQNVEPGELSWPVAGPGEPEGANLANPINAYVFGSEAFDLHSEELRLFNNVPLSLPSGAAATPAQIWELAKYQRGAIDPDSGLFTAGAFAVAQEHFQIAYSLNSVHGNNFGGFMPAPENGGACLDPEFIKYEIIFTNLLTGTVRTFFTCPDEPLDIARISPTPHAYWVILNNGTIEVFLKKEWLFGPFTGGAWVTRTPSGNMQRVLNWFASEFRGTPEQRATQKSWLAHAFDVHRFKTTQYHLAPQRGSVTPEDGGPHYVKFRKRGEVLHAKGSIIPTLVTSGGVTAAGAESHTYEEGFVLASAFIETFQMLGPATLQFWDGETVIEEFTLTPDSSGALAEIVTFENVISPKPLTVRWGSAAQFQTASGFVQVEVTELLEYKPEIHDLALVLRLSAGRTSLAGGLDGSGATEENSKAIGDSYFANGCILNAHGSEGIAGSLSGEVNSNSVYEAARLMSKFVHIIPRHNFIGLEVQGGKSICYFKRYAVGHSAIDLFDGIAPNKNPILSGEILPERRYIVRSGTVGYGGINYITGNVFTGVSGSKEFDNSGTVYEYDGIRHTAEPQGETNEWLMGHQLKVYHQSESSLWKPESYSDYFFLSERCHFYAPSRPDDLRHQFDYGALESLNPEAPTGWRYAHNTNAISCGDPGDPGYADCVARRLDRYKSCRIYEPDPEIESVTVQIEAGQEVVKVVFKTRFHHHSTAPASFSRDVSTWNTTDLRNESYRTMENGLREYLVWAHLGLHCVKGGPSDTGQQGNAAVNSSVWGLPDDPNGACFPHFYFVKLIPKVYEDGNDRQDPHDTPLWHTNWKQLDLYMAAMCEGYVDGLTSSELGCLVGTNALFDYRIESLCFEAFGGQWFSTIPTEPTSRIAESDTRPDLPQGFGPVQNTILSSELYNQRAAALNLMNRVRVMLPTKFQIREWTGSATKEIVPDWPSGPAEECLPTGQITASYWSGAPVNPTAGTPGAWTDAVSYLAQCGAAVDLTTCGNGGSGPSFNLVSTRTDVEWRWQLIDPDALEAVPEAWRDMIENNGRLLATVTTTNRVTPIERVTVIGDATACDGTAGYWADGAPPWIKFGEKYVTDITECVVLSNSGKTQAPALLSSGFGFARTPAEVNCNSSISSEVIVTPVLGDDTAFIEVPLYDL